jgi:gluconate 2-dehydrogenase gamma chain
MLAAWSLTDAAVDDAAATAWAAVQSAPPKPQALTPEQIRTLEAVTARLVPTDDTPGAREAGAVWFIDRLLARWAPEQKPQLATLLAGLDTAAVASGARAFVTAAPATQDSIIAALPAEARQTLVGLTIMGLVCPPAHGGNRGQIGWRLVGHDPAMAFTTPYGYYDTPANLERLLGEARAARQRETGR